MGGIMSVAAGAAAWLIPPVEAAAWFGFAGSEALVFKKDQSGFGGCAASLADVPPRAGPPDGEPGVLGDGGRDSGRRAGGAGGIAFWFAAAGNAGIGQEIVVVPPIAGLPPGAADWLTTGGGTALAAGAAGLAGMTDPATGEDWARYVCGAEETTDCTGGITGAAGGNGL